jgi:ubiquinone/menaquinone biosynthesis C-methylase UbiE
MSETRPGTPAADRLGNADADTIAGFGREWARFRQGAELSEIDRGSMFDDYFHIFPWARLPAHSVGMDVGCGSGRWAMLVAPRVGHLHLVDASAQALDVARNNLAAQANVTFHLASVADLPVADGALDFAYSLGVLHHVPDTAAAIDSIARTLKPGAPFLLYLYYAFDNRAGWYRALWRLTDWSRRIVSRVNPASQRALTSTIAALVYWPLARGAAVLDRAGGMPASWPLAAYRDRSFYVMRTDAHDRFCTRLEQRFTRPEIETMLRRAGFAEVTFSDRTPYWCAVAIKR